MTPFSPADSRTWPAMLSAEQVCAIYGGVFTVSGLKKRCQREAFTPRPARVRPYLWRKCDVVRDVEGQRGGSPLRRVG